MIGALADQAVAAEAEPVTYPPVRDNLRTLLATVSTIWDMSGEGEWFTGGPLSLAESVCQPLSREEAINLCAWVGVIADLTDEEVAEARAAILSGPDAPTSQAG